MDELERIRLKKMRELMNRRAPSKVPKSPVTLTDTNFKEVVNRYPLVLVDCWAPWCHPCRIVAPIIEELAKELAGKVVFGKLNVDENPNVARESGIMSIPTLLVVEGGKEVDRIVGAVPKQYIVEKLKSLLVIK